MLLTIVMVGCSEPRPLTPEMEELQKQQASDLEMFSNGFNSNNRR